MQSVHVTTPPSHTDVEIFYICIHTQQLTKIQMTSRESVVEEQERERERDDNTLQHPQHHTTLFPCPSIPDQKDNMHPHMLIQRKHAHTHTLPSQRKTCKPAVPILALLEEKRREHPSIRHHTTHISKTAMQKVHITSYFPKKRDSGMSARYDDT
jgi:hypothetical protein